MSNPPAVQSNGSLTFMWVSLIVMAAAFVMIGLQQRHRPASPETGDRAISVETVATPDPEPAPPPANDGMPRNM